MFSEGKVSYREEGYISIIFSLNNFLQRAATIVQTNKCSDEPLNY